MLTVHPSGFYAWLKRPFSKRAEEDKRQVVLLKKAWEDSGKVYVYRKLHDDLQDQGETVNDLYAFLTCEPNPEVGAVHPKAMPVFLTTPDKWDQWLATEWAEAGKLQRALPDGSLEVMANGGKIGGLNANFAN